MALRASLLKRAYRYISRCFVHVVTGDATILWRPINKSLVLEVFGKVIGMVEHDSRAATRRVVLRKIGMTVGEILELFLVTRIALTVGDLRDLTIRPFMFGMAHCTFGVSLAARRFELLVVRSRRRTTKGVTRFT